MNSPESNSNWRRHLPTKEELILVLKSFSKKERIVFTVVSLFFLAALFSLASTLNGLVSVSVPSFGGELSEGIIGTPRFVNPVLALSDADRDLTALVYSGLMKKEPSGKLIPDLAENYEISPDGLSYLFNIKDDTYFQDGTPVTADDVEFTVARVKDPLLKSPKRVNWEGVLVQKVSDKTVKFVLKQKYFPFLEIATLGILPKHLWKELTPEQFNFSDFNTKGVGSGPYEITAVQKNSSGIPNYYELRAFSKYALGKPFIDKIVFHFYSSEGELITAFDNGIVSNINSIEAKGASVLKESGYRIERAPLPRVFAVFFNQSQNQIFTDKAVKKALAKAVDKERIVNEVLYGYGVVIDSPLPGVTGTKDKIAGNRYDEAKKILTAAGWTFSDKNAVMEKKNKKETIKLKFSLATGDVPELKEIAKRIKEDWGKIGAQVELKVFEIGDLNQNVIRPRKYDALFFGEILGFNADPFPFWHSSQRNDPGLNIALYTNAKADKILDELRGILDEEDRAAKYQDFIREVENDAPAVFVFSPEFTYFMNENLGGVTLGNITEPSDRFLGIRDWYLVTDNVWKPFARWATR
ncbi:MAG: ABC transporter substrate-binding protein [Patescibacteria group bacterium]